MQSAVAKWDGTVLLQEVDVLLRGASLGVSAVALLLSFRIPDRRVRMLTWGLISAASAFVMRTNLFTWSNEVLLLLRVLSVAGVACFWMLARLLFDDSFKLKSWHNLVFVIALGPILITAVADDPKVAASLRWVLNLSATALTAYVLCIIADRRDDLIESRRKFRLLLLGGGSALVLSVLLMRGVGGWLETFVAESVAFLALKLTLLYHLMTLRNDLLSVPNARAAPTIPDPDGDRLIDAMVREKVYHRTGLTIADLAAHLAIPEYRLRETINRRLGYRNFNDFLNDWRLKEAQDRLSDPSLAAVPILTIALDLGYGSIGPFNRAFKARFDTTPSEFRQSALS
jgi:AraC-like DNA-binding protein